MIRALANAIKGLINLVVRCTACETVAYGHSTCYDQRDYNPNVTMCNRCAVLWNLSEAHSQSLGT